MIMHFRPSISVLALLFLQMHHTIASSFDFPSLGNLFSSSFSPQIETRDDTTYYQNPNGQFFVWLPQDEYSGDIFFECVSLFLLVGSPVVTWDETLTFINKNQPVQLFRRYRSYTTSTTGFAYIQDGTVFMKGDDTTWLADGEFRNSIRISSISQHNTSLFILDINRAPWGCAIWPAWWTVGGGQWRFPDEIDILEGVHDNEHNQVTWHTGPGCFLSPESNFTGAVVSHPSYFFLMVSAKATVKTTPTVTEQSLTMRVNTARGIRTGSLLRVGTLNPLTSHPTSLFTSSHVNTGSFFRAAVPADIVRGTPNPSQWGSPVAALEPRGCDPIKNVVNHLIVFDLPIPPSRCYFASFYDHENANNKTFFVMFAFLSFFSKDVTFGGDWAGNSYAAPGCPGTCADRLKNPSIFEYASWSINYMKVYKKQPVTAIVRDSSNALALSPRDSMFANGGEGDGCGCGVNCFWSVDL
ncbi:hypothetical protein K435DRAFT_969168 [Dendrothele bispora CBS 962.96]|uniref:GH16 domain-containing protein n=1 Tax=Dendrothele bispora (strain CBS 962.96) TaxID=1314807 RepID=A0A4S8LJM2_DENBC|nr:hypothetical protein K435DRAFT_969168 [Dendrothele bispora CBS 962.96]